MKKYVVATVLALSLVVGLLIGAPVTMASAKTTNCSLTDLQSVKASVADKNTVADLISNICNKLNINNNWLKSILEKCTNIKDTAPDDSKTEEEVKAPAETPKTETPAETPKTETPKAETPKTETPAEAPKTETPKAETPKTETPAETPKTETPAQTPTQSQNSSGLTAEQSSMLKLVNQERTKAGLKTLQWDAELARVADIKAQDMVKNNYFSHTSPTYGSPFDMMKSFGIKYKAAGENLAGHSSVESAHTGLMNSEGHRANILNSNFTHIGIGVQKSPRYGYVFVQMFIGK